MPPLTEHEAQNSHWKAFNTNQQQRDNMEMPKDELLSMLYARGYEIRIDTKEDSKYVTFIGKYSLHPEKLEWCYSSDFTDSQIREDVVYELLKWTGLKVRFTLEY